MLSLLCCCCCRSSKIVSTRLSPPTCKWASNLRAHTRFSQRGVTTKHLGIHTVLNSQNSVWVVPPVVLTATRGAPPIAMFLSSSCCHHHATERPTRHNLRSGSGGNEDKHKDKVTPPCHLTGALIHRKISVFLANTCCTMLLR